MEARWRGWRYWKAPGALYKSLTATLSPCAIISHLLTSLNTRQQEVGSRALPILLGVLQEDAPEDVEIAKAVVETLSLLCEVEEVEGRVRCASAPLHNTC